MAFKNSSTLLSAGSCLGVHAKHQDQPPADDHRQTSADGFASGTQPDERCPAGSGTHLYATVGEKQSTAKNIHLVRNCY